MKVLILTCLLALTALASALDYKKVENFDFSDLLSNDPSSKYDYRRSIDCFLDKAPCGEAVEMKETLMAILKSRCEYCSPSMLVKYNNVLNQLKEEHPEDYTAIMNKISNKV